MASVWPRAACLAEQALESPRTLMLPIFHDRESQRVAESYCCFVLFCFAYFLDNTLVKL